MRTDANLHPAHVDTLGGARPFGFHTPHWAQFVAADHDGMVWAFQSCPSTDAFTRSWTNAENGGRYVLLGSCKQEVPYWEDALFLRRGGLWRSLREAEQAERDADFREATSGTLWAIVALALLVLSAFAIESTFF